MRLHENKELFRDAIIATSQLKNITEIYVEKDYWVTLALYSIFSNEIGKSCIFKGGTALSKCNRLVCSLRYMLYTSYRLDFTLFLN